MPRLRPIRRNPRTGLLPKGLKRRPSNKTWRKGHHLRSGKWIPGIWVFRAGKAAKRIRAIAAPKRIAKPRVRAPAKVSRLLPTPVVKRAIERPKRKVAPPRRITPATKPAVVPSAKPRLRLIRKPWSSERKRRARLVAGRTGAPVVQADALIRRAKSKDVAYDKVTWENLQGKDLTFAGRVRRLNKMVGPTASKRQEAMDLAARRADFREKQEMRRRERRRKGEARPNTVHAAMSRIEEEFRQRAEHMERALFQI